MRDCNRRQSLLLVKTDARQKWPAPRSTDRTSLPLRRTYRKCNKVPVQDFLAGTLFHCLLMRWLWALLLNAFAYKFPLLGSEAVGRVLLRESSVGG